MKGEALDTIGEIRFKRITWWKTCYVGRAMDSSRQTLIGMFVYKDTISVVTNRLCGWIQTSWRLLIK